ncbi:hypothetical protein P171DRAFT_281753 [Karstenula rhodostoma CBS 690.94]|uniref:Uncharacterized protein n=1 Tax=Karstenula rhodostoma CBS 690.94 TaxID=1392251 RepID=A0A9P4PIT7_9PLEO|nr:hypothetical protein P171DRAFT_281753 [Karstenula rhodostoma CBS 690.94]
MLCPHFHAHDFDNNTDHNKSYYDYFVWGNHDGDSPYHHWSSWRSRVDYCDNPNYNRALNFNCDRSFNFDSNLYFHRDFSYDRVLNHYADLDCNRSFNCNRDLNNNGGVSCDGALNHD